MFYYVKPSSVFKTKFYTKTKVLLKLVLWFHLIGTRKNKKYWILRASQNFCEFYILSIILRTPPSIFLNFFFGDQWQSYLKFIIKGWIMYSTSKKRFKNVQIYGQILTLTKYFSTYLYYFCAIYSKTFCQSQDLSIYLYNFKSLFRGIKRSNLQNFWDALNFQYFLFFLVQPTIMSI